MQCTINHVPLDLQQLNQCFVSELAGAGAMVTFTGFVRDYNEVGELDGLELEYYPGMTERALEKLRIRAIEKFTCLQVHIAHRVGLITNYEPIVWVAASAYHRKAAFDAAMFTMDTLKQSVPLWKKEWQQGKATWVEAKASDEELAMRWLSK